MDIKTIKSRIKTMEDFLKKVKTSKNNEDPKFPTHMMVSYLLDLYVDTLQMNETLENMASFNKDIENVNSGIVKVKELFASLNQKINKASQKK